MESPIETDFLQAVRAGDAGRVSELLDADPSLPHRALADDAGAPTAILLALYQGRNSVADMLAERSAGLNIWEAAAIGHAARLRALLHEQPAVVDAHNTDGHFPLGLAAFFGRRACAEALLEHGADVEQVARNVMAVRAIHAAAAHRDADTAYEIVRLLVAHGAQVNVAQHGGWTPLHQAAHAGNLPLAELLLECGADPFATVADGATPVAFAEQAGHARLAEIIGRGTVNNTPTGG